MAYLYTANLDIFDRRDQLQIMLDNGDSAILKRGSYYDLTAGELARARQYVEMVFVNTPATSEPEGVRYLPIKGNPTPGQVPVWDLKGYFIPGAGGGGGGGSPTGSAGGVLSGSYPNPDFLVEMATQAELDTVEAAKVDKTSRGAPIRVATENGVLPGISGQTELTAFYAAVPTGAICVFPASTSQYIGLHTPGKRVVIIGGGKQGTNGGTEFVAPAAPSVGSSLVNFAGNQRCSILDVKLNGNSHANMARGILSSGNGTDKHLLIARCTIENFTSTTGVAPHGNGAAGVYCWTAQAIAIAECDFNNCTYPVYMDTPTADCIVIRNRIRDTLGTVTKCGITIRRTSSAECGGLVGWNDISTVMTDPSGIGVEGHGIDIVQCRGMRLPHNVIKLTATAGIHLGSGSWGFDVDGGEYNLCGQVNGAAIYAESGFGTTTVGTVVSTTTTATITLPVATVPLTSVANIATEGYAVVGGQRVYYTGVSGNNLTGCTGGTGSITSGSAVTLVPFRGEGGRIRGVRINAARKYGVAISYCPNTVISDSLISRCGREGIFSDSERTRVVGCALNDNYGMSESPNPTSTPNVKAQIRFTGTRGKIVATDIIDRLGGADYAIAVNDSKHQISITDGTTGGATGVIYQPGGASTNIVDNNITA